MPILGTIASNAELLTALNAAVRIRKTADESRNTTTTLANDATLLFTTIANTHYYFKLLLFYTALDIQFDLNHLGTTSAVRYYSQLALHADANAAILNTLTLASAMNTLITILSTMSSASGLVILEGILSVGASGGVFSLRWAQNVSSGTNATVLRGSMLEYQVIS